MMRRLLCVLVLCLVFVSMALGEEDGVWDFPEAGLTFTLPQAYLESQGVILYSDGTEYISGDGVYGTTLWYTGLEASEVYRYLTLPQSATAEEQTRFIASTLPLFTVYGINGGRDEEALRTYLVSHGVAAGEMAFLGSVGECSFFLDAQVPDGESVTLAIPDFAEEYLALLEMRDTIPDYLAFREPPVYALLGGNVFRFETVDTEGNPISSEALFAQHEITMINVWASWCRPCIREMPELEKLNALFAEKDCAIVGLLYDGTDDYGISEGKAVMEDTGVTYTVLLPWATMATDVPVQAFPTTFFVNRQGEIVGETIVGAYVDRYAGALDSLLEALK